MPVADVSGPLSAGKGVSLLSAVGTGDLSERGFVEEEFVIRGTATSLDPVGDLGRDGRWVVEPRERAPYATRIVVRRPATGADANGTVVVEWLNVSAGSDSAPDWTYLSSEIIRGGYTWVGVSAQQVGVTGGAGLVGVPDAFVGGLVTGDPERYGGLEHPGDAFAFDLFTQVALTLRQPGPVDPLGGLAVQRVLAVGESQSAFMLTTYVNAEHPRTHAYDGYLIHSRGAGAGRLDGLRLEPERATAACVRDDLDVPVMIVEAETDVGPMLRYFEARQPDTDRIRVWEMAGTAHADDYQIGGMGHLFGFAAPVNDGPQHFVVKSALRHLDRWAAGGPPPPRAPRLSVVAGPAVLRDGLGNALGGIRTPLVDVPVAALSGENEGETRFEQLFGRTTAFDSPTLAALYPSRSAYLLAFRQSATDAIAAGFVLPEDEDDLLACADPSGITSD